MPCYLQTRIIAEKFKTDPQLFRQSLPSIIAEIKRRYPNAEIEDIGGIVAVTTGDYTYLTYNANTYEAEYTPAGQVVFNIMRRGYSRHVVKTVAGRTSIKSKFQLNEVSEREYLLKRRR